MRTVTSEDFDIKQQSTFKGVTAIIAAGKVRHFQKAKLEMHLPLATLVCCLLLISLVGVATGITLCFKKKRHSSILPYREKKSHR